MRDDELISVADRAVLEERIAMTLRRSRSLRVIDQTLPVELARRLAGEVVDGMVARQFWVRRRVPPTLVAPAQYAVAIPAFEGAYDYNVATRLFWRHAREELASAARAPEIGEEARGHNWPPAYNVPACSLVPVVRYDPRGHRRQLDLLRWGITPNWLALDDHPERRIVLRADYLMDDAAWRPALRHRRCLVVIEGYYEWRTASQRYVPHAVARADGRPMLVAALWDGWKGPDEAWLRSCAIITTFGNTAFKQLAHRIPLILEPADIPLWLGESPADDYRLKLLMTKSVGEAVVRFWPVADIVNGVDADGPECLTPLDA